MTNFKRVFSRFLHRKPRKQVCQRGIVIPTANDAVTPGESCSLPGRAHSVHGLTNQIIAQPLTDVVVVEVEPGSEDEVHDTVTHPEVVVPSQTVQSSTDTIVTKVEEVDQGDGDLHTKCDDDDFLEVYSCVPARNMRLEMVIHRLYVAVTNDDQQVAALQTLHPNKFTHIVRVAIDALSDGNNIRPSNWKVEFPDVSPHEVRLTCPALVLNYDPKRPALNDKQIRAACNFIIRALPEGTDVQEEELEIPIQQDTCKNTRVLIVAPPNRSVDIMTIVMSYMSYISCLLKFRPEAISDGLRRAFQREAFAHSHWGGDILGKEGLDMADRVSKKKW